jgi:diacylglycerol kinase (ATP)
MSEKIIYLINPISGTGLKSGIRQLIEKEHALRGIDFEILPTEAEGRYELLKEKIAEGARKVVVCGGDGSVNSVAAALMNVDVSIGIIPMGSGNGLARTAGISKKPELALANIFTGAPSYIDGLQINENFSCMLCGIGFDAEVAHEFANRPERGLKTYIKVTASQFFSAKTKHFRLQMNGQSLELDAFLISVANSNQFGNDFKIAPRASLNDGLLDIVIVQGMNKLLLPFTVARQMAGWNPVQDISAVNLNERVLYFQTDALTIENPDNAPLHIDGDPKSTAQKFEIRVIRNAFRLIMPVG